MIRVAFTLIGGKEWMGGQNYLHNLLTSLLCYQHRKLTPVLFVGKDCGQAAERFHAIHGLEIIYTPYLDVRQHNISMVSAMLPGKNPGMQKVFKAHHIDLVFEAAQFFGWSLNIPAIAWIPDFQHKMMPQMFSRGQWLKREFGFRMQLAGGRTVMVSSEDAWSHFQRFYPRHRNHVQTIHFAIPPGPKTAFEKARAVADSYGLPANFFFLPNQFYRHKNHGLVLEAMKMLHQQGQRIVVAASGKQNDLRNPGYFYDFLDSRQKYGLENDFILLGMIPYSDLLALMRACTAMLNPSLFEGWSTTVEEARVMGTPMLLSDIAVHKEQMNTQAVYFDRHDAQSLADMLADFMPVSETKRRRSETQSRADGLYRVKRFSEQFVDLVGRCLRQSGKL